MAFVKKKEKKKEDGNGQSRITKQNVVILSALGTSLPSNTVAKMETLRFAGVCNLIWDTLILHSENSAIASCCEEIA